MKGKVKEVGCKGVQNQYQLSETVDGWMDGWIQMSGPM